MREIITLIPVSARVSNPEGLSEADVAALRRLPDMGEHVARSGAVWTKFSSDREFKVSPRGEWGDFDSGCYWVAFEDVFPKA